LFKTGKFSRSRRFNNIAPLLKRQTLILAADPSEERSLGAICPLPRGWEALVAPWASFECRVSDFGISLIQKLELPFSAVYILTLEIEKPVSLYLISGAPTITFQFALDGNLAYQPDNIADSVLEKGKFGLFYIPAGAWELAFVHGRYEICDIELGPKWLEIVGEGNSDMVTLLTSHRHSDQRAVSTPARNIKYTTMVILQNLRRCVNTGGSLLLEMYKFTLELLSEYRSELEKSDPTELLVYHPHRQAMNRIRNYILTAPNVHEHTIPRLARKFNHSETFIKTNFRNSFQTAVSTFVRYCALVKAELLVTTTQRTVEDIAEEIGYSSREALERAFKKQYGFTPSALRWRLEGDK
jgi:AraC-like DNA-binding protein